MTFKRKLDIATPEGSPRYDPLRRFYVRKGYIKPLREDASLKASPENYGSKIQWSLGGWDKRTSNPVTPTRKQMNDWVSAYKQDIPEDISTNDYLASGADNTTISLPGILSQLRIDSMDRILTDPGNRIKELLANIESRTEEGELTDEARNFYGAILETADDNEALYEHAERMILAANEEFRRIRDSIRTLSEQRSQTQEELDSGRAPHPEALQIRINMLTRAIRESVILLRESGGEYFRPLDYSFQIGTLYLYDTYAAEGLRRDILRDKIALYNAVKVVLGESTILRIIQTAPQQNRTIYDAVKIREETPFMTRSEIYPFLELSAGLRREEGEAQTNPEYVLYDKSYEEAISGSSVPENVQPSLYIYNLYTSADIDDNGLRIGPSWQGSPTISNAIQREYAVPMTLEGNIPAQQNLLNDISVRDYLDAFARKSTSTMTGEQKTNINNMLSTIMFPVTELDMLSELEDKKRFFPMHIETSFAPSAIGEVGEIIKRNKVSSTMLEYFHSSSGEDQAYEVRSDYFVGRLFTSAGETNEDLFVESLVPVGEKLLKTVDIYEALSYGMDDGEVIESMVLSAHGSEPVTRQNLTDTQKSNLDRAILNIRSNTSSRTLRYYNYLGGETESPSEALGYRLVKLDEEGTKIQDILFANSGEMETIKYIDTQVKYDKKYHYELNEYRLVIGTEYELFVMDALEPRELRTTNFDWHELGRNLNPSIIYYDIISIEKPIIRVIEIPIYGSFFSLPTLPGIEFGISYPEVNIMSHPPTAPDMQVLPLLDNFRQIKINIQLGTGTYTGANALKIIDTGQNKEKLQALYTYQKQFENYGLQPGHLEYKNEGIEDIRKVVLLRSRELDLTVSSYEELYASFTATDAEQRILSMNAEDGDETVISFDVLDTLDTNVYYYYTCYVEDVHGNPSLPAPIYRVRLIYEKGLFIPEIELFQFKPISNKAPTRRFARFIQIAASDIQTFPFFDRDPEGVLRGTKNLASQQGNTVVGSSFIFRLTSRDTGRKFDIKVSFGEKLTEEEDENISDDE